MSKRVLDLSVFEEETLEVKFKDGSIHIKKPTESLAIKLLSWVNIKDSEDPQVFLDALRDMTKSILNHNTEGIIYTDEQVDKLGIKLKIAICHEFKNFITELESNPNS